MGVKEKALTAASSIASGDFLRMVTSAGAARKIDYSKLAKAIVEEYNGSTIAGSAQTLKAALDSLNSKLLSDASLDSLSEMTTVGIYFSKVAFNDPSNPSSSSAFAITYIRDNYNGYEQFLFSFGRDIWARSNSSTTWKKIAS